MKYNAMKIR
jgi:hypothetical protein